MSDPTRDPLDQAIDRVAARMVSVDHDEVMVERIVARLPERSGLGGWLRVLAAASGGCRRADRGRAGVDDEESRTRGSESSDGSVSWQTPEPQRVKFLLFPRRRPVWTRSSKRRA